MSQSFFTNALPPLGAPLGGTERFPLDLPSGESEAASPDDIKTFVLAGQQPVGQYTENPATSGFTATEGEVSGGQLTVLELDGTLGAGENLTTPTASALFAATGDLTWIFRVVNTSGGAFAWTLVGGTGVTVLGTATVPQGTWREWLAKYTSPTTLDLQSVGAGDA